MGRKNLQVLKSRTSFKCIDKLMLLAASQLIWKFCSFFSSIKELAIKSNTWHESESKDWSWTIILMFAKLMSKIQNSVWKMFLAEINCFSRKCSHRKESTSASIVKTKMKIRNFVDRKVCAWQCNRNSHKPYHNSRIFLFSNLLRLILLGTQFNEVHKHSVHTFSNIWDCVRTW